MKPGFVKDDEELCAVQLDVLRKFSSKLLHAPKLYRLLLMTVKLAPMIEATNR